MKPIRIVLFSALFLCSVTGCATNIQPDSAQDGTYSTQTPMTSLEYSIYMNKQITVFANQISTRLLMANNSTDRSYENEADLSDESVKILEDVLDEVTVTKPAATSDDDREKTIQAMQTALEHMQAYAKAVRDEKDVTKFKDDFQNDFNALTGLANLYYQ